MEEAGLQLKIDGLNMDQVYENFVRQIAGEVLQAHGSATETLKESVERDQKKKQLQKQIDTLTVKMRREKQLNKQMVYNAEIKKLRKELAEL